MIDAHCHPTPPRLAAGRADGVTGWVGSALLPEDLDKPAEQAEALWWSAGIHPWAAPDVVLRDALAALESRLDRVVAVGETGLDHGVARDSATRRVQRAAFRAQLALARERDLPVVLHVVRAHGAALEVLRSDGVPGRGGLVHGFSGALEVARGYLALGLHLGLGAAATNPRAKRLQAALPTLPSDRIVVETDDSDVPLSHVVAAVAAARGEPAAQTARYTTANARALFGLP